LIEDSTAVHTLHIVITTSPLTFSISSLVGLLYAVLAGVLSVAAYFRSRHSRHDFADQHFSSKEQRPFGLQTAGQEGTRIFGRPFVTAGWIVVAVTVIVATMEVALLALVLQI
jgi:hypothetical protein